MPVSGSTILASEFDKSFPVAPTTPHSFGPTVPNTRPVDSVRPYALQYIHYHMLVIDYKITLLGNSSSFLNKRITYNYGNGEYGSPNLGKNFLQKKKN